MAAPMISGDQMKTEGREDAMNFTVKDARYACEYEERREKLTELTGLTGDDLDNLRLNPVDVLDIWGLDDALWSLKFIADPRARVRAIWPAVLRAQEYAEHAEMPEYVAEIQRWLDGDDSVDLQAAADAADAVWAAYGVECRKQESDLRKMFGRGLLSGIMYQKHQAR